MLFYDVYLWVVFVNFYQPFLKKSIYTSVEYLLTVFCHYHYMIVAVIHAIALFAILYFFLNRSIARRFRIVYIYLLTQVVLRSNHKNFLSFTELYQVLFNCVFFYFHFETKCANRAANRKISIRFEGKITILHKFNLAVDSNRIFFYD